MYFSWFLCPILKRRKQIPAFPKNFVILDEEDQKAILKNVYHDYNIDSRSYTYQQAISGISIFKNENPDYIKKYLLDLDNSIINEELIKTEDTLKKIILGYLYEQKKNFGLDFDDLIEFSSITKKGREEVLDKIESLLVETI